jgi:Na+/H+-translocating membrane pyrophosphatase
MAVLPVRHLQSYICVAADGNNMLLEQPNDRDKLRKSADEVQKGSEAELTYQVMVVSVVLICPLLQLFLLAALPPP